MPEMKRRQYAPRRSEGFSLDEAARIREAIVAGGRPVRCPRCRGPLDVVAQCDGNGAWLVACGPCRVSLVVRVGPMVSEAVAG
jgi:hypothetical protein